MIILIHTSKTMRPAVKPDEAGFETSQPELITQASMLNDRLKQLSVDDIASLMSISPALAAKTRALIHAWTAQPGLQRPAIDSFIGDIYSGLQVPSWSQADRTYANSNLRILSGLYGILKPLDGITPYRLEMGYKLQSTPKDNNFSNLYTFWKDAIAATLPSEIPIINVAAVEYTKAVLPYVDAGRVTTPAFLTVHPKTRQPTFVVVHAKIARGALASWIIKHRISDPSELQHFDELGYNYDATASTPQAPVFVCQSFGGLGLSLRLK